jgi:hypothetical protein
MTMIDNMKGFGASLGARDDLSPILIELNDNKIYGESEIDDCPADGSFCIDVNKFGVMLTGATFAG